MQEQIALRARGSDPHQRPRPHDMILDRRTDPPHRIGRETIALVRVEAPDRVDETDGPFLHEIGHRQAVAAIGPRDANDKAKVAGHQARRGRRIALSGLAGKALLFLGAEHGLLLRLAEELLLPGSSVEGLTVHRHLWHLSGERIARPGTPAKPLLTAVVLGPFTP
jgi:hypothetical protein